MCVCYVVVVVVVVVVVICACVCQVPLDMWHTASPQLSRLSLERK